MKIDIDVDDHAQVVAKPHKGGLVIWVRDINSEQDLDLADTILEAYLETAVMDWCSK